MTPDAFRAAVRRLFPEPPQRAPGPVPRYPALAAELRRLGWRVSLRTIEGWGSRGAPPHVAVILELMEAL